jgi:hypothetical protein
MNTSPDRDVFVSYNSLDHAAVESIARALGERGLTVFLDRWELVPGRPWPEALEERLDKCTAAAVVLGPYGMGAWQQREHYLALNRQARDPAFGVIPVILPNADPGLGFLSLNTWVDLRGGVDDTQSIDLLAAAIRGQPAMALLAQNRKAAAGICPYRGLQEFREEDAPFFFGREAFAEKLREAVTAQSLVAVVGASGSGKSSVVRAGLVPSLRRSDSGTVWEVVTLVPGDRPLYTLSAALLPMLEPELSERKRLVEIREMADDLARGRLALRDIVERVLEKQQGTDRLLLVVDQWEELYTRHRDNNDEDIGKERTGESTEVVCHFIDELLAATDATPLTVVLTLRSDFYGEALMHRGLADRFHGAVINLGPMTREELEWSVTKPAEKVGFSFDTGLVDRLLDDVGDELGNLPLLEFALTALWKARRGNRLLYAIYKEMGGVKGAIAKHAETVYAGLDPEQQKMTERVFTLLVRPSDDTRVARRRATLDEFNESEKKLVRTLAGKDTRLLVTGSDATTNQETVEVAHEALLREWPKLKSWIVERRDALRLCERVRSDARAWIEGDPLGHIHRLWPLETIVDVRDRLIEMELYDQLERDPAVADLLTSETEWLLAEICCEGVGHQRRRDIGQRLAEIGDPRPGVGVIDGIPDILWRPIPAGEVEIDGHGRFPVKPFRISAYLVTVAQFRAFLDAEDGYDSTTWWIDLEQRDRDVNWTSLLVNQPMSYVRWYDATAFCRWLSTRLRFEVRLPDEWEWQWATQSARDGFIYPWRTKSQDGLANTMEPEFQRPTAVGMYPNGASKHGVFDLAGKVREWCRNEYAEPNKTSAGGDRSRVLRGGSWDLIQDGVSAVSRHYHNPNLRYDNYDSFGFRVVCASPIR